MSMFHEFIPSFVIHDSVPSPLPSTPTQEIGLRHLFLRNVFPEISHVCYALLSDFFQSPFQLGFQAELKIFALEKDLPEWVLLCQHSPYVQKCVLQKEPDFAKLGLRFTDGTQLVLSLLMTLPMDNQKREASTEVERSISINRHGIKVAPMTCMFGYWFVYSSLQGQEFPDKYAAYFSSLSLQQQFEILDWMEERLGLSFQTLGQALRSPRTHKAALLQTAGHPASNWVRDSWSYFFQKVYKA